MHSHERKGRGSASHGRRAVGVALVLSATLVLGVCANDDDPEVVDTGDSTAAATALVTETPPATATGTMTATETPAETITPAEPVQREGIAFLAPEGWVGNADAWTSPDGNVTLLFATVEWEPPMEPEAVMLPEGAVNLDREEVDTPLGPGALHTIEMADENVFERHAIIRTEDRIYDWWLAAESVEQLDEQQDALQGVLDSITEAHEDG